MHRVRAIVRPKGNVKVSAKVNEQIAQMQAEERQRKEADAFPLQKSLSHPLKKK